MVALVKLTGIAMVVMGVIYFVKPGVMKKYMRYWMEEKKLYMGAVLNLVIGLIFLIAASNCLWPAFVRLIGVISLIKGIMIFYPGPKKIIPMMEALSNKRNKTLRGFAVLALIIGILVIYSA
jgi:uncharacterized protein YjeT (DUF2065 family)